MTCLQIVKCLQIHRVSNCTIRWGGSNAYCKVEV